MAQERAAVERRDKLPVYGPSELPHEGHLVVDERAERLVRQEAGRGK
jgi:hypothetical protein